jgi:hypothetical protein
MTRGILPWLPLCGQTALGSIPFQDLLDSYCILSFVPDAVEVLSDLYLYKSHKPGRVIVRSSEADIVFEEYISMVLADKGIVKTTIFSAVMAAYYGRLTKGVTASDFIGD